MINASYKIDSRTKSLIFEAQILNGVPLWFDSAPPLAAFGLEHAKLIPPGIRLIFIAHCKVGERLDFIRHITEASNL